MACSVEKLEKQFPWGYFVACLSPIVLIGMIFILPSVLGPQDSMGPAMLSSLLIGPASAIVVGWGVVRLWRGDGQRFPALRWLLWLPAMVSVLGFFLG